VKVAKDGGAACLAEHLAAVHASVRPVVRVREHPRRAAAAELFTEDRLGFLGQYDGPGPGLCPGERDPVLLRPSI
jgi:hypothetical protein